MRSIIKTHVEKILINSIFDLLSNEWILGFLLNLTLILIFYRFPLLTNKGWLHSGALGTILFGCLGWQGWFSVVLYLVLGTVVTRLGFKNKKKAGIEESRGGRRGPENVWGSAATGMIIAILIKINLFPSYLLMLGFAASFSAKLADTFGSEIGKRWGRNTLLISSLKSVPPGTDGAISLEGTLASLLGSILMSSIMYLLGFIQGMNFYLIVILFGFMATILESYIGASLQKKYSILTNEMVNFIQTLLAAFFVIIFASFY